MGARHVVALLAATGPLTAPALIPTGSSEPPLLVEFRHWMSTHRGTTAATVHQYRLPRREFLAALGEPPAQYPAQAVRALILEQAQRDGSGRAKTVVTAVRMLLRCLIAVGHCAPGLAPAIPPIARWRRASLPTYLSAEAVARVIASCDLTTPRGTRDRAVLLLRARLALRAGDVPAVQVRHLDWEGSPVQVAGKSRRHHRLPLPPAVGDAIRHYLDYRPPVPTDQGCLTTRAPFKRLSSQAVGTLATPAMARAGPETPIHGSHVLRPSAATQMRRAALPLSAIGVVLRHASMETTAGYAQVDVPLLQAVVQPWPEVTAW
jgi:site-specific recombinase XerC